MRSRTLAERLLARYTTEARAASIAGDLLEEGHAGGGRGFWWSLCAILVSFAWRRTLAFVFALIFGLSSFDFLHNLVYSVHGPSLPSNEWRVLLDFLCLASILLSFGMPYTVIRYGVKDAFAQQVIAVWGLTSILSAYWWMPVVMVAVTILGTWGLLVSLLSGARRQGLLASVVALVFAIAIYWLASFFMQNLAGSHLPVFHHLAIYAFTLGLALQPVVYGRVQAIFWRKQLRTGAS